MTSTSPITTLASQAAASNSSASTAASVSSTASLGNEDTFLQLLVAQIQNQDPTQPVDSSTFLTQLAQFSSLEQLVAIQSGVSQLDTNTASLPGAASTNSTDSTNQAGS